MNESNKNNVSDDGEGLDPVQKNALNKKFKNRKDKDIDNDGDVDSSDEYLHKRRKAVKKAMKEALKKDYRGSKTGAGVERKGTVKGKLSRFTDKEVRMATGIAKQQHDNMTTAVSKIEKIKKGLSDHPEVSKALRRYNESYDVNEGNKEDLQKTLDALYTRRKNTAGHNKRAKIQAQIDSIERAMKKMKESVDAMPSIIRHDEHGHGEVMEFDEESQMYLVLFDEGVRSVAKEEIYVVTEKSSCKSKKESDDEEDDYDDKYDDDEYSDDIQKKNKKDRKRQLVGQKESTDLEEETLLDVEEQSDQCREGLMAQSVAAMRRMWENRAERYKSAAAPADKDNIRDSGKEMEFKNLHRNNVKVDDTDEKGHDDATRAGKVTKQAPARNGDNLSNGDKKPVKPVTK